MDCLVCHQQAGYNRAVVDVLSGTTVGALCRNCELDHFGHRLEIRESDADGCAFCERDGHYALAKWLPQTSREGDAVRTSVDYRVTDDTVHLCDEHLTELRELPADPPTTVTGGQP